MGTCLSKKKKRDFVSPKPQTLSLSKPKSQTDPQVVTIRKEDKKKKPLEESDDGVGSHVRRKEVFIIKHRKSHDGNTTRHRNPNGVASSESDVDAILLQCGRLSRNSSGKPASSSGSKKSHDFYHSEEDDNNGLAGDNSSPHLRQHRRRRRSPGDLRRRTPSREKSELDEQRPRSREKRVLSRSPSRRLSSDSHSTIISTSRPAKIVSVPATDKSYKNNGGGNNGGIKRISVKRNVGSAASSRSQSPARTNNGNNNAAKSFSENHQQASLSRDSSRKAVISPFRRNPLSEIHPDSLAFHPQSATSDSSRPGKEIEVEANQKTKDDTKSRTGSSKKTKEQQEEEEKEKEDVKGEVQSPLMAQNVMVNPTNSDILKPLQTPLTLTTRSRSSRRSRTDIDQLLINPETPKKNPPSQHSYTSLLLEDIQNFHQNNNNNNSNNSNIINTPSSIPLPACVVKACSILEAVADLNSTTSSINLSGNSSKNVTLGVSHCVKRVTDPLVESEVVVFDDVMQPSFHKYVTEKESSGSKSFSTMSDRKHMGFSSSSSSWEPKSGDSTDRWTCSTQVSSQHPRKYM